MRLPRGLRGLHARFSLVVAATLVLMLAVVGVMLQRQAAAQQEVVGVSRDSMRTLVGERLTDRTLTQQGRDSLGRTMARPQGDVSTRGLLPP